MSSRKKYPYPKNMIADAFWHSDRETVVKMMRDGLTDDQYKGLVYALSDIGGREEEMLIAYYRDCHTYQEIGDVYGLTRERVRSIISRTLRRLRSPVRFMYVEEGYNARMEKMSAFADTTPSVPSMDSDFYVLDLSVRACNILRRAGKKTVRQVAEMTEQELMGLRYCGGKSTAEILEAVETFKRSLSA